MKGMDLTGLNVLVRPVIWLWKKAANQIARHKARKAAFRGEDLAALNSLPQILARELENLAARNECPAGVQPAAYRNWLRDDSNLENFATVLIANAGGEPEVAKQAQRDLLSNYEALTRNTKTAPVDLASNVASYVVGQLRATDAGWQRLQLALTQWSATQLYTARHAADQDFPSDADLRRVRAMATAIVEAGKRSWKMPRFVAPLRLETFEREEEEDPRVTTPTDILEAAEAGRHVILFGSGGIGKTTLLLELATSLLERPHRIPVFVDAAAWGRAGVGLLEHIAGLPEAQANGLSVAELTKLAIAGHLVVLVNGWNEMSATSKLGCREVLVHLTTTAERLGVLVVSRSPNDSATLPNRKQFEVRGLAWEGQAAIVRAELGNENAAPVLDALAKDTRLRHASRSPLILRGVVAAAKRGVVGSSSVFDLLGAAVAAFEEDDQRNLMLSSAPVDGHQHTYLEELACVLTGQLTTTCSREEALQAIHSTAEKLVERRLIGGTPNTNAVLEILTSHHLLHFQGDAVRFAHHRFQEYFAATRLLRICTERADPTSLLPSAANQPAWEDALVLVAEKLKGAPDHAASRIYLVRAAAALDIGFACDLAGACGFDEADDRETHRALVVHVNALAASPLHDVRDLGVAYQIASRLPAFADQLWPLLENENQQIRLTTHRLNGAPLTLKQLGPDAQRRVAAWMPERRAEFLHEIAENPDNYDFVAALAQSDPEPTVRAAAISALFWNFPASDVPLTAWLNAPESVQAERHVVDMVRYALEDGHAGAAVRERLEAIAAKGETADTQIHLAIAFPAEIGPRSLEVIFTRLREADHQRDDEPLVAIAKAGEPERLLQLAQELVRSARLLPAWVGECLRDGPPDVKHEVIEQTWASILGQGIRNLHVEVLGPLANYAQVERAVGHLLQHIDARRALTDAERDRERAIEDFLSHAPGDHLLRVVMQLGRTATYGQSAYLIELLLRRIGREAGRDESRATNQWLPNSEEVRQLVTLYAGKEAPLDDVNDAVRVHLCRVASHVAPAEFTALLLETCARHLDAWNAFHAKIAQWSKAQRTPRPMNPYLGNELLTALANWGPEALPELLKLLAHPSAMNFVPEAIVRLVSLPWAASKRERLFGSIATDLQEGERRRGLGRVALQPDDKYQAWTDEAAKSLEARLGERVTEAEKSKATDAKGNSRSAEYAVGGLAQIVSNIPSAVGRVAVTRALASGMMDIFGAVSTVRNLLRQGVQIEDASIAEGLEALYDRMASTKWFDESSRHAMANLCELLVTAVVPALLAKPTTDYLQEWRRYAHQNEIVRQLGATRSDTVWPALVAAGREMAAEGRPAEEFIQALVNTLSTKHLGEFFALLADGTLAAWSHHSAWTIKRLAPTIAAVIQEAAAAEALVEVCRSAQSPFADALAGEVLSHIEGTENLRQAYLLDALDAGRAVGKSYPAYGFLRGLFKADVPLGSSQFRIDPIASNNVRTQLYARAKGTGPVADGCRRLLASIELGRREMGRPNDEPRNPAPAGYCPWTDTLLHAPARA